MKKSSVVIFPLPVMGHINPMLRFAASLVSQGLKVTLMTTRRSHSRVIQTIEETMVDSASSVQFVSLGDDVEEQGESKTGLDAIWDTIFLMHKLQGEFEKVLEDILVQEHRVTCLVSDFLMDWTGDIAAKLGIPRAAFWTSTATNLLLLIHTQTLVASGCVPLKDERKNDFIPCIEGVPKMRAKELPFSFHHEHPVDPGFRLCQASIASNLSAAWVVINTFEEIEREAIHALHKFVDHDRLVLGQMLPRSSSSSSILSSSSVEDELASWSTKDGGEILKWLDARKKASVLYVSFGTVAGLESMKQLEELANGLEASGQEFVWVFRSNLVEDKLCLEFMKRFQERTSRKGLVVPWASQLQVLQHPAVGGFLTHCGWNSALESIWSGVPMLGWPCMAEQNLNHKFIVGIWKIGLEFEAMDRAAIASAIVKLMEGNEGDEARKRITELGDVARTAVAPGGSSHKSLDRFVKHVS